MVTRRTFIKGTTAVVLSQALPSMSLGKLTVPYKEFDISRYETVLLPRGHGQLIKLKGYYRSRYPSRDHSMQLIAFFNKKEGLYVQTKDPVGYISDWEITLNGRLRIYFYGPVPEIVVKKISPDYKIAAKIYREWALQQSWAQKKSSIICDLKVIATGSSNNIDYMKRTVLPFLEKFDGPTGCWLTMWRRYPFDVQYPDYVPSNPTKFKEFLTELHNIKSIPFPYINGLLWDENSKSHQLDLSKVVRDEDGAIPTYNKKLGNLKFACPATDFWKNIILNARNNLLDTNGNISKGVYYDVFAATKPRLCFALNHGHEPGDPLIWKKSIRDILERTEGSVIVEGNAEVYIDLVDGFLMHQYTNHNNIVPLWNEVYGSQSTSIGWFINKKSTPIEMINSINKSKQFGVSAFGSPWMTSVIQEKMMESKNYFLIKQLLD